LPFSLKRQPEIIVEAESVAYELKIGEEWNIKGVKATGKNTFIDLGCFSLHKLQTILL